MSALLLPSAVAMSPRATQGRQQTRFTDQRTG